jgi:multiple sugar transport system substrate-binding protein
MKTKGLVLFLLLVFLLTSGLGCGIKNSAPPKTITLKYWRAWDEEDAFNEIIKKYNSIHPNVKIDYRKFRFDEYEQELLNALAEDRGPDIFSIPSTWIKGYQNKIEPLPESLKLTYLELQGSIKKELVQVQRDDKSLTVRDLRNNFIDQVASDVILKITEPKAKTSSEKIFGLPLYVDTLAMFYNKELFNNAGIAEVPTVWNDKFLQNVKKLTKQNTRGEIIQAGVALGGSTNIERSSDLLSVLMMQNGAVMINDHNQVSFDAIPKDYENQRYNPGLEALRFYTDFSSPAKEVYCWNNTLDNSLKMFEQGRLAIMFGYAYHLPILKAEAPKLNFSVAKLPQIYNSPRTINFANYYVETVSKKSKNINEAWDFIQFATKADQAKLYLAKTKKPTALRSLIDQQLTNQDLSIFADQVLTAKSWYHGSNVLAAEKIINEMIDQAVAGQASLPDVIELGARRVQQTLQ